ncbi:sporulation protein [Alkalihalobacillus sp. BA299]|uniref:sporulation protein n=1 Tax=Alkalihalobacillus sp. BA299 TaxID=2815938 RepID=UPI001ADD5226|nr:sporulation protein [Alkalihalobacillus sp. BA299]
MLKGAKVGINKIVWFFTKEYCSIVNIRIEKSVQKKRSSLFWSEFEQLLEKVTKSVKGGEVIMFEKILSSIGIGSAKVNTVLLKKDIERGKVTKGEVHIFGGKSEQKISKIYIHVDSEFHKSDDDMTEFRNITEPIVEIEITDVVTVSPHEEKIIPFSFILPYYTPITFGKQKVTLQTELDINFINHPVETNDFNVTDQWLNEILSYLNMCGYTHTNISGVCRHKTTVDSTPTHCLQTFNLVNDKGMKVYFVGNEKDIHIYVYNKDRVLHHPIYRDRDLQEQLQEVGQLLKADGI